MASRSYDPEGIFLAAAAAVAHDSAFAKATIACVSRHVVTVITYENQCVLRQRFINQVICDAVIYNLSVNSPA